MKYATLILGLVIVLASIAVAHAGTIPPKESLRYMEEIPTQFRGAWCMTDRPRVMVRCKRAVDDGDVELTATELRLFPDSTCGKFNKILTTGKYVIFRVWCGVTGGPEADEWPDTIEIWRLDAKRIEYRELEQVRP